MDVIMLTITRETTSCVYSLGKTTLSIVGLWLQILEDSLNWYDKTYLLMLKKSRGKVPFMPFFVLQILWPSVLLISKTFDTKCVYIKAKTNDLRLGYKVLNCITTIFNLLSHWSFSCHMTNAEQLSQWVHSLYPRMFCSEAAAQGAFDCIHSWEMMRQDRISKDRIWELQE